MSGRHVATSIPPIRLAAGERCPHPAAELCPLACDHGGRGRHVAPPRPSTWLGAGITELAARSSSQAGLASFRGAR